MSTVKLITLDQLKTVADTLHEETNDVKDSLLHTYASKSGDSISVWIPYSSEKFVRFDYSRRTVASANKDVWKQMGVYLCNAEFEILTNLFTSVDGRTEWEGVVLESGMDDFVGGYHGNEIFTAISIMIDGAEVTEDFDRKEVNWVEAVEKSDVFRYGTTDDKIFTRYKESRWSANGYQVRNRWIASQGIALKNAYLTMISLPVTLGSYEIGRYARNDDTYVVQDRTVSEYGSDSPLKNSSIARTMEIWGKDFFSRVTVSADCEYIRMDRTQDNTYKLYAQYAHNRTLIAGDELTGISKYQFGDSAKMFADDSSAGVSDSVIQTAVEAYLEEHPASGLTESQVREIVTGYKYLTAVPDTYRTAAEQDKIHDDTKQDTLTDADKQAIADMHQDAFTNDYKSKVDTLYTDYSSASTLIGGES